MKLDDPNIRWIIPVNDVWKHFTKNREELKDRMDVICRSDSDSAENIWWLFVTVDLMDPFTMLLSLENNDTIIDSASLSGSERVPEEIERLIGLIDETSENKITDFYIGQTNASGIKAKSKKEFFEYLSDLITEAEENEKNNI